MLTNFPWIMITESEKKSFIRRRLRSFRFAWEGIIELFCHEDNAKIHFFAALTVIIVGFLFHITPVEWCLISMCIGGVFMAEGFNTAVETLADKVSPEFSPLVKKVKDVAAGAVLLFVISSVIVGLIVFIPYIVSVFK